MIDIKTIMSTDVVTVLPDSNLERARTLMHDLGIHHLPVVGQEGNLVGLISVTIVLAATDSFLRDEPSRLHPKDIKISEVMITDIVTVDEHAGLREAARFLEQHDIGCLPVVTNGKLNGIITNTDFVGVAINLLEHIESTEPVEAGDEI